VKKVKRYFVILFLLALAIFISGCIGILTTPGEDSITPGKGRLEIYLTDDPGDYEEVNIFISKIEGHIAVEVEENEEDWEVLMEWTDGLLVDLTELEDVSILLASLELEPNKYTQLRLFLKIDDDKDAWLILNDEDFTEVPLVIPSVYHTGIKLIHPFEIWEGEITKLTIDFDAEKSVVKTGNGEYKLKPVIKVTSETYSEGELPTGLVFGTVSYYDSLIPELIGIGGAIVSLSGGEYIFGNTTTTSGEVGLEGTFSLDNVPVGNYTLNVNVDGFDDYSESIEVIGGSDTEVNVVFLLKEPGTISGIVLEDSEIGPRPPISGATVSVSLSGGVYIFNKSELTDEDGLFFIEQLPVGTYTLIASAEDYIDHTENGIEVTEGEATNINIELIKMEPLS
jgi:hypothetical protein